MPAKKKKPAPPPALEAGKRVTIYDLADHTGFSPGTVSRVLNNRENVKPETRRLILKAARELDIKPQVSVRSRQVAILSEPTFTDRIEGYAATLTAHLAFALSKRNIGLALPSDPFEQLPGMFLDGIIAVTFDEKMASFLEKLEAKHPVVYMDRFEATANHYRVCSDHYHSGRLAARHFLARGRKRLAYFGGEGPAFAQRLQGFRDALVEAKAPVDERLLVQAPGGAHQEYVTRLVRAGADAIFVPGTSFQSMECLHLISYVMGLRVPEDVSIIGGENEGISSLTCPPLTTIEEPLKDMAERAVEMIDALTAGRSVEKPVEILPVRLIERDSVA